jgi:hypothetical protein
LLIVSPDQLSNIQIQKTAAGVVFAFSDSGPLLIWGVIGLTSIRDALGLIGAPLDEAAIIGKRSACTDGV